MTLGNMRKLGGSNLIAHCLRIIIPTTVALSWTTAFAFSFSDCGIESGTNASGLRQYRTKLRREAIASDPGMIGKLDKADPFRGSLLHNVIIGSLHRMDKLISTAILPWTKDIESMQGRSALCSTKVGVEKSWEHNVDHATFWITKIIGEPIRE
jgi:hypothetical protein